MAETTLQYLKYATTLLTLATAFAGTWLFEFATPNRETGRRQLTRWGRRAVVFASLSLVLAIVTTVWSDILAGEKAAKAADDVRREKDEAKRLQAELGTKQSRIAEVLAIVQENISKLTPDEQKKVRDVVEKLDRWDPNCTKFDPTNKYCVRCDFAIAELGQGTLPADWTTNTKDGWIVRACPLLPSNVPINVRFTGNIALSNYSGSGNCWFHWETRGVDGKISRLEGGSGLHCSLGITSETHTEVPLSSARSGAVRVKFCQGGSTCTLTGKLSIFSPDGAAQ